MPKGQKPGHSSCKTEVSHSFMPCGKSYVGLGMSVRTIRKLVTLHKKKCDICKNIKPRVQYVDVPDEMVRKNGGKIQHKQIDKMEEHNPLLSL